MARQALLCLSTLSMLFATLMAQFNEENQRDALQTLIKELKQELRRDVTNTDLKSLTKFDLPNIDIPEGVGPDGKLGVVNQIGSLPVDRFPAQYQQSPLLSAILNTKSENNLEKPMGVDKRQGRWDFDYGLGGGRFGKRSRMFADYALGGGRFGRDTDHVLQFDDVTDYEITD